MKKFKIDMNLELIQNIRFAQALLEITDDFFFDSKYNHIFDYLNDTLQTNYSNNSVDEDSPKIDVEFEHSEPSIIVGDKKYTLIYPRIIESHLKPMWLENRSLTTFNGILTPKRYRFLKKVIKTKGDKWKEIEYMMKFGLLLKLPNRLLNKVLYNLSIQIDDLRITVTNKGRKFPEKAWDDDYFSTILNSKYVLCPDGDFTWTYRFFESIICGAIPVIENTCSAYEGFNYLTVDQYLDNKSLSKEQIESNFQLLIQKFTLDSEDVKRLRSSV